MRQLKSVPSHTCLKDRTCLRVPWERRTITQIQKTQSTCFHHQMLPQVFNLFSADHSQAAWSHAALHDLLSSLHRCLGHRKPREEDNPVCLCLGIVVRKDFQSIHLYLKEKKHSCCAGEVVRAEMERPFSSFHNPQVQEKVIRESLLSPLKHFVK
ncbi:interferon tau-2-like [Mustela nigripes]|uniref:interferon tau-2-like n=1 Tax=Mustela nigripes TaxID=77151 RepID=UPI002815DE42|nr:interferon tau-2-like [Mustela nigripes]